MTDTRVNVCDPIVNMFGNYGILIDGTINPVQYSLIKFNGHDRFDRREGAYFNYVQPDQHHSNTPKDGINVYSFAIHPEEHQPSGTTNLSRINSTDLFVWFNDSTFEDGKPIYPLFTDENQFYIFATNYNVLRILAGFAGIAYA
jgi:hypothetical protein